MADFKLDTNGDLAIENNSFVLLEGLEAIAQDLRIRLKFFLGEWFLDTRQGMPYFEKIFTDDPKPNLSVVKSIFRKALLLTPGVLNVTDLVINFDGQIRKATLSFKAVTSEGVIVFDKELIL